MTKAQLDKIRKFVADNIGEFHANRLALLRKLNLNKILERRNPYLCKAKNLEIAHEFVRTVTDGYLTQREVTIFGNFLEELALFVGEKLCGCQKSSTEGVDLEFTRDNCRYIVSVKSGPNWGNSNEVKRQRELFRTAKRVIRQSRHWKDKPVEAVIGCCFGRDANSDKGDYHKKCGQEFWRFLSGDDDLYVDIVAPLGHEAKSRNDQFKDEYARILNEMTQEFSERFCVKGRIQWEAVVKFNSSAERPKPRPRRARKKS